MDRRRREGASMCIFHGGCGAKGWPPVKLAAKEHPCIHRSLVCEYIFWGCDLWVVVLVFCFELSFLYCPCREIKLSWLSRRIHHRTRSMICVMTVKYSEITLKHGLVYEKKYFSLIIVLQPNFIQCQISEIAPQYVCKLFIILIKPNWNKMKTCCNVLVKCQWFFCCRVVLWDVIEYWNAYGMYL